MVGHRQTTVTSFARQFHLAAGSFYAWIAAAHRRTHSTRIWRWCSGIALVATLLFVTAITKIFRRRLNLQNVQRQRDTRFIYYVFGAFGVAAMLLQVFNIALLGAFWPFFAGIVFQLVTAMAQFARMILLMPE